MEDMPDRLPKTLSLDDEPLESDESDCNYSVRYQPVQCPKIYINGQKYYVIPHVLIEVFSVRFIDHSDRYISGNMRIQLLHGDYYLFGNNKGDSCSSSIEVDSQGYAVLMPDSVCPLDVLQDLMFYSHVEKVKGKVEGLRALGRKKKKRMKIPFWDNRDERDGQLIGDIIRKPTEELLCKQLQTQAGPIEIAYAVFVNGVEALVDVTLYNWRVEESESPIKLYGKVIAKSSLIRESQAKSILFQREKARNQYFCVDPRKQSIGDHIPLPLSRRRVVISRHSALKVYIDIWQSFGDTDDKRIAKGKVELRPKPGKSSDRVVLTEDFRVIQADDFDIHVKVKWVHDTRISCEGGDSSEEDDA